jgi:hypothetical protein
VSGVWLAGRFLFGGAWALVFSSWCGMGSGLFGGGVGVSVVGFVGIVSCEYSISSLVHASSTAAFLMVCSMVDGVIALCACVLCVV